jgi:branched-chain amino acid transport system substrate-binding protein
LPSWPRDSWPELAFHFPVQELSMIIWSGVLRNSLYTIALGMVGACSSASSVSDARQRLAADSTAEVLVAIPFPWASYGETFFRDGLSMAVDEVNATGGVHGRRLRLLPFDDKSNVEEARRVAQRIAADPRVMAVIGHLQSSITVPTAAIYDRAGLVLLAPTSTDEALTQQGYTRVFRPTFTQDAVGRALARWAADRGLRRLGIYYVRDRYGRGMANAFEAQARELGLAISGRESYAAGEVVTTSTVAARLRAWSAIGIDGVLVAGELPSAATIVRGIHTADSTLLVLGGDAMSLPSMLATGAAAEGALIAAVYHPSEPRPAVEQFTGAYQRRFGREPDAVAAVGYDAIRLLAAAMRAAPSVAPADVAVALRQLRNWSGVTGSVAFDSLGNAIDKHFLKVRIRAGQFVFVESAGDSTRTTVLSDATPTEAKR